MMKHYVLDVNIVVDVGTSVGLAAMFSKPETKQSDVQCRPAGNVTVESCRTCAGFYFATRESSTGAAPEFQDSREPVLATRYGRD